MTTEFKTSIRRFVATIELLKLHGVDQKRFFNKAGLHLTHSLNLDERVDLDTIVDWIKLAGTLIEDDAIGLHAGEMCARFARLRHRPPRWARGCVGRSWSYHRYQASWRRSLITAAREASGAALIF